MTRGERKILLRAAQIYEDAKSWEDESFPGFTVISDEDDDLVIKLTEFACDGLSERARARLINDACRDAEMEAVR